jgi:glycosyltransferase involved in cell wall biosynthesis
MLAVHRWLGTWTRLVDCYIVFTEFFRRKFTEAGIPGDRIVVKPHFVHPDPGAKQDTGAYALFVGRLAPEKGVQTLLSGWKRLRDIPLKVRGEGPLLSEVVKAGSASVELVPRLISKGAVSSLMRGARFLVWPSEGYYETFGCVAAEAFSCGVPVVASRIGVAEEIVEDGHTGLHFTPGNAQDLAAKVEWAWTHPGEMALMGRAARAEYEAKYTADRNYQMLMGIYQRALRAKRPG